MFEIKIPNHGKIGSFVNTVLITLPANYAQDTIERDLDVGDIIEGRFNKKTITFESNYQQLEELASDCEYYCNPYGPECPPVNRSAKRALPKIRAKLKEVNPDWEARTGEMYV